MVKILIVKFLPERSALSEEEFKKLTSILKDSVSDAYIEEKSDDEKKKFLYNVLVCRAMVSKNGSEFNTTVIKPFIQKNMTNKSLQGSFILPENLHIIRSLLKILNVNA